MILYLCLVKAIHSEIKIDVNVIIGNMAARLKPQI